MKSKDVYLDKKMKLTPKIGLIRQALKKAHFSYGARRDLTVYAHRVDNRYSSLPVPGSLHGHGTCGDIFKQK